MDGNMLRAERQAKILQIIREKGSISSDELIKLFNVSHVTIRRDLVALADQKLIILEHGGATSIDYLEGKPEPLYDTKLYIHSDKKTAIAREAIKLIKDGDILILDSGTTNYRLAQQLKAEKFNSLTVITSDIMVAKELSPHSRIAVIILGGIVRKSYYNAYGPFTELVLGNLKANKLFLGFDGANIPRGFSNNVLEEVSVKQKMMAISDETIALGDSTKYGVDAPYTICGWEKIQRVITDSEIDPQFLTYFSERGLPYHLVEDK